MLQIIRDKTTGWIAVAIVALLIIPFAFWGINYYFTGGEEPSVATVNGQDIKLTQFQRTYSNYRLQMQNLLGKTFSPDEEEFLKQQTLEKMAESELLNQVTREEGLRVSNELVKETIKNIDVFKDDDGFNRDYYLQSIMRLGMPPAQYEEQMRLDMMSEQLQSAIIESEFATNHEIEKLLSLVNQKRDLTYTIIAVDKFRDTIEVSDAEIEKFYNENPQLYNRPEQVKISYLELNLEDLAENINVTDDELRAFYESNKTKYDSEEQRKITQILIKTDEEGLTDEKLAAAKAEAEKILGEINSGKTIEEISKLYAEDKNSNFSISEYGFLPKGILQPEVDEVVFSMQKGGISEVIKTKLGFHIVRLEEIKGGVMNTFENSREEAEKDYRYAQAEELFFDLADQLGTLAYEHPDTLEVAAEDTGVQVQESDYFDNQGTDEGISSNPVIVAASFSEDVLKNRHNSELLELTDRQLVVLRLIDHKPQAKRPLEEVREDVIKDIRFTEATKLARELGQEVIADLQSGKDLEMVAKEKNITWENVTDISREDVSVNRSILRNAFTMPVSEDNKPVYEGISLGSGDFAVINVRAIHKPEHGNVKDNEIDQMRIKYLSSSSAASWQQYLEELKANAKITLFKERIE